MSKLDYEKIFVKDACPTSIGGQAVMEGVMMQGPDRIALAMRLPSGELYLRTRKKKTPPKVMNIPFVRGIVAFALSLVNGMTTLMESADILEKYAPEEYSEEPGKLEKWINEKFGDRAAWNFMMTSALVVALLISVVFFIILPTWVVNFLGKWISSAVVLNLIEGLLRIAMFIGYVAAIRNMEDIKTLFRYHGAEHKTIHCFENGLDLTPDKADIFYTLHPRCGTSFLVFVLIISLLLFSFLGWPNLVVRILSRLLLIPVIAGISYELLKWAGRSDGMIVRVLSYPGLMLQKLTTAEPTLEQLEVAILSLKAVLTDPETADIDGFVDKNGKLIRVEIDETDIPSFAFDKQLNPVVEEVPESERQAEAPKSSATTRPITLSMPPVSEDSKVTETDGTIDTAGAAGSEEGHLRAAVNHIKSMVGRIPSGKEENDPDDAETGNTLTGKKNGNSSEGSTADVLTAEKERYAAARSAASAEPDLPEAPDFVMSGRDAIDPAAEDEDQKKAIELAEIFGGDPDDFLNGDDENNDFDEYISLEDLDIIREADKSYSKAQAPKAEPQAASPQETDTQKEDQQTFDPQDAEPNQTESQIPEKLKNEQPEIGQIQSEQLHNMQLRNNQLQSMQPQNGQPQNGQAQNGFRVKAGEKIRIGELTELNKSDIPEAAADAAAEAAVSGINFPDFGKLKEYFDVLSAAVRGMLGRAAAEEDQSSDLELWQEGSEVMSRKLPDDAEPEVSEEAINEAIRFLDAIDHDGYTIVAPEAGEGKTLAASIAEHDAILAKARTMARRYTNDITTIENALEWGQATLSLIENGRNDAITIMMYATGMTRTELITRGKELMREDDFEVYDKRIHARLTGTPLQYITGMQEFMGLPFRVNPSVLIPRQDTEVLVEKVIDILAESDVPHPDVLDMCTGSGVIGVSIADRVTNAYVTMSDASDDALHTAMSNAGLNGVNRRCVFLIGDMFDSLPEDKRFDVIVCNPPYIRTDVIPTLQPEVRDHEPREALDGGEDGLDYYRIIAEDASAHLKSGGILALEIGADQAGNVKRLLMKAGTYTNISKYKDLAGLDRVIIAERI